LLSAPGVGKVAKADGEQPSHAPSRAPVGAAAAGPQARSARTLDSASAIVGRAAWSTVQHSRMTA